MARQADIGSPIVLGTLPPAQRTPSARKAFSERGSPTAQLSDDDFVKVTWSHKLTPSDTGQARYYSGWLYQTGLYGDADFEADLSPRLWTAETFKDIPRIDGSCVIDNEDEYFCFLKTLV